MIRGSQAWNVSLQDGMCLRHVGNRDCETFADLPESLYHSLAASAGRVPDGVAIVDDWGRKTSYADLLGLVDGFASWLSSERGIGRGSRVGLLLHADLEFVESIYAISKLGAMCVPIPTKYRRQEVASLVGSAHLDLVIMGSEFAEWESSLPVGEGRVMVVGDAEKGNGLAGFSSCEPCPAAGELADPAILMFTSGTTSSAKGVVLRNYNLLHAATVYARLMGTTTVDRCLIPIPIYHVTGLVALLFQFVLVGGTVYLQRRFDAHRVLSCIRNERITYLHGSPTSFAELLPLRGEFPQLPSVRAMLSGSSYEPVEKMRAFHAWMPTASFQVVYGLTETSSPALLFPYDSPTSVFAGATGKPVPGIDVKLVDEEDVEVAVGEEGMLLVRGACVTEGYDGLGETGFDADGWLVTGDVGYANEEGMVWVVGRTKEMVNRGGEKVWCNALEEVLAEIDGVRCSCVAGIPDELYGEVPVAAVVSEPGSVLTERGIQDALKGRIAHFKIPVHVVFVDRIPQTRGDKPDRRAVSAAVLASLGNES